jgi:hypothetical protein
MGRAIFSYEMTDPDFSWLITSFAENRPEFVTVDVPGLPIFFLRIGETKKIEPEVVSHVPPPLPVEPEAKDDFEGA